MAKRKTHSASFKSKVALEAIKGEMTVAELAAKYEVPPTMVTKWKKQGHRGHADTFSRGGRQSRDAGHQVRIKELHAKIGELTVEKDFFKKPSFAEPRAKERFGGVQPLPGFEHRPSVRTFGYQPLLILL